ncbi:secretory lipase family [Trichoderma arundinaceum]|uniref:Secretory lipase family n=1 Tax=Trichoderma arundinaceum TaxID=490622 RepID=A0A395NIJ2_TRIAR|nr:secretory lipase family [Trichoderma arundinaceum]
MVPLYYWLAASLAASASGFRLQHKLRLQSILPPSEDSFYAVPENIDTFSPGQIINHRKPPSEITAYGWAPAHIQRAYQILYRTTDSRQKPTATVLTVLIPPDADYGKVVSFQMAEDSATIDCSPSYTMQRPTQSDPLLSSNITQLQLLFAEAALAQKWIVAIPDFEGPEGSFAANKITGHAILDGVRAAKQSGNITGIASNPKIGLWGYSGGAAATQMAITMQEHYAPELEIAGVAMGGLPGLVDATGIFKINKGPSAALIPSAMIGLSSQHPELRKYIDQSLKPQYRDMFFSPLHQCLQESTVVFSHQDILGMFHDESIPGLTAELIKSFNYENEFPPSRIKPQLYIYQSVIDHLSAVEKIDELVRDLCEKGVTVHYERANSTNLNHVKYGVIAVPRAISWMQDRFDGIKAREGCLLHTDPSSTLDPRLAALYPKYISDGLIAMINAP